MMSGPIIFIRELSKTRLRGLSSQAIGVLIRFIETGREHSPYVIEVGGDLLALALICRLDRGRLLDAVEELRRHGIVKVRENTGNRIWLTVRVLSESRIRRLLRARARVSRWRSIKRKGG